MVLIGEQLEQHESIIGFQFSTSSSRFTLFLKDWKEEWEKEFKEDVIDFLDIDEKTNFSIFFKK